MKNLKYLALGILVGYLVPYIYILSQSNFTFSKKETEE